MEGKLNKEVKRLSGLNSMKGRSTEYIEKQSKINLLVRDFRNDNSFSDNEKELAEQKFKYYLNTHEIESLSDIDILKSLIFNEILEINLQKIISQDLSKEVPKLPGDKLTKQLTDLQNQKITLKIKLGIDKEDIGEDDLSKLEKLKKRFEKHINENKHEFTIVCACCGKLLLLRKRVKDFECMKHPFFAGRWYFNYEIMSDVKNKMITKEQAAKYLKTSVDYIDYCLDHWTEITDYINNN